MSRIAMLVCALSALPTPALAQASAAPSGAAPASAVPSSAGGGMSSRLADLEHRMGALEEDLYVSRAHLAMMMPDVGSSGGARVRIRHHDAMPATYRLVRVAYLLDGARIYVRAEPRGLPRESDLEIFTGAMPAGDHVLSVELEYRGDGFDVFRYAEGYHFEVTSSHDFHATSGEALDLEVLSFERGTPLSTFEGADVRYREEREPLGH